MSFLLISYRNIGATFKTGYDCLQDFHLGRDSTGDLFHVSFILNNPKINDGDFNKLLKILWDDIEKQENSILVLPENLILEFQSRLRQLAQERGLRIQFGDDELPDGKFLENVRLVLETVATVQSSPRRKLEFRCISGKLAMTWYKTLEDVITVDGEATIAEVLRSMDRGTILAEEIVRVNHLVVVNSSDKVIGLTTRERLEICESVQPTSRAQIEAKDHICVRLYV
jgi:hypothetical protein